MLGKILDGMIAIVAPGMAVKRAVARAQYAKVSSRAFDAAKVDRRTNNWTSAQSQSADRTLYGEAERIRNRVRDLVRNNAYAKGALDAIVANVVGCGIVPRPMLADRARSDAILRAWNTWCESSDVGGRLHFYEMQSLALSEMIESGEDLTKYVQQPDPIRKIPLALELIESERIASDTDNVASMSRRTGQLSENEVRRGVELNANGKAVAFYLYRSNPFGMTATGDVDRVDAADVLHLFRANRIGQTRGVSWLAPAVQWLRDLGIYVDNEIQASTVASCFSVVIKTMDSGDSWSSLQTPSGGESTDADDNRLERLQPGLVSHLMPGEDVSIVNPNRPNANADPWVALMLRSIAVAMGLSYELISRDYSRTNYSSNRASALEDRRRFRPLQKFMVWHYCQPIYREWFRSAVLAKEAAQSEGRSIAGLEAFPSLTEYIANPEKWLACKWRPPGWEWVDPLKEGMADKLAVDNLFKSRGDVIEGNGGDLLETWQELSDECTLAEAYGLELPMDGDLAKIEVAETAADAVTEVAANAE